MGLKRKKRLLGILIFSLVIGIGRCGFGECVYSNVKEREKSRCVDGNRIGIC